MRGWSPGRAICRHLPRAGLLAARAAYPQVSINIVIHVNIATVALYSRDGVAHEIDSTQGTYVINTLGGTVLFGGLKYSILFS